MKMCCVFLPMLSTIYRDQEGSSPTSNVSMKRLAERSAVHSLEPGESGGTAG